jgi:hypothetical protein
MNYWLHPEAQDHLREPIEFYREKAGTVFSQSMWCSCLAFSCS